MQKTIIIALAILLGLMITSLTLLAALGKDFSSIVTFLSSSLIPAIPAIFALAQATKAKDAAEQTVQNTNGRMRELIQLAQATGADIPEKYREFMDAPHQETEPEPQHLA